MPAESLADRVFFTGGRGARSVRSEGEYTMLWTGVFVYKTGDTYECSPEAAARAMLDGELLHNNMLGSYRIAMLDERTGTITAWGDNCGSTAFFYDADSGVFSDSLLFLLRRREKAEPCFEAIADAFAHVPSPDGKTPVEGIYCTLPENYYTIDKNGTYKARSKLLWPIDSGNYGIEANELAAQLIKALNGQKYSVVCDGGENGRAVLDALLGADGDPLLTAAGESDSDDIRAARELSETLERPLKYTDTAEKDSDWLRRAFEFSDGCGDVVYAYRNMKRVQDSYNAGVTAEFGSGAEYDPLRAEALRKGGIPSTVQLARRLYGELKAPAWAGEALLKEFEKMPGSIENSLTKCCRTSRMYAYSEAGRMLMRARISGASCAQSRYCVRVDIPAEPRVIASAFAGETDAPERFGRLRATISAAGERVRELTGKRSRSLSEELDSREDDILCGDREKALASDELTEAMEICIKLGVVAADTAAADIPQSDIGNILRMGMLFSEKYGLKNTR